MPAAPPPEPLPNDRLPTTADEIDAAWLTAALAARHPGARVRDVEVVRSDEVTNSHARLRVTYAEPAGAPEALFCKLLPLDPTRREVIAQTGMGLREAKFYEQLAPTIKMRVPDAAVARYRDDDGTFVLLLEDLDDTGCEVSDGTWGISPDGAAQALEDLAELHARFADPSVRRATVPWTQEPGAGSNYAVERLAYGLEQHRDRLSDEFVAISELYIADRGVLHALWGAGPLTVVHGDTHIGNLFVDAGRVGFLDWGVINVSPAMRDVSYLLNLAMQPEDRRAHERDLILHYLAAQAAHGGAPMSFDDAWLEHRVRAAYTVPASCQIVLFPDDIDDAREVFANAFLARAEAAIQDLDARGALREVAGI